jgi:hypothetical protein
MPGKRKRSATASVAVVRKKFLDRRALSHFLDETGHPNIAAIITEIKP